jgi:hypothetical protein
MWIVVDVDWKEDGPFTVFFIKYRWVEVTG